MVVDGMKGRTVGSILRLVVVALAILIFDGTVAGLVTRSVSVPSVGTMKAIEVGVY